MKILMLIPCWGRPEIVRIVYDNLKDLPVTRLWVLSEEDRHYDELFEIVKNDEVCVYKNDPLGEKMNAGIEFAMNYKWDYLMNWGSDDLMNPFLLSLYEPLIEERTEWFGINSVYTVEHRTKKTYFIENYNSCRAVGAGRMISRGLINAMRFHGGLYGGDQVAGLDGNSDVRVMDRYYPKKKIIETNLPLILDVKTNTNINAFPIVRSYTPMVEVDNEILKEFGYE